MSWEKTGQPGCQAPSGSVSGADVRRRRATRLPRLGAPPPHQTAAVRRTGPDRVEPAYACALGALSALWVSAELPPVTGGTVGSESRDSTPHPPAGGAARHPARVSTAPH